MKIQKHWNWYRSIQKGNTCGIVINLQKRNSFFKSIMNKTFLDSKDFIEHFKRAFKADMIIFMRAVFTLGEEEFCLILMV